MFGTAQNTWIIGYLIIQLHPFIPNLSAGLIKIFIDAGGVVEYPSCGPCIGGHLGVLGPNEIAVSSTNRNFKGRMGDPTSKAYLTSPAIVAASALEGYITLPY